MKLIRFLLVGASNTCAMYLLYAGLVWAGLSFNLALVIDYVVGVGTGYLMNRHWTFASHTPMHRTFPKYVLVFVLVYLLNAGILNVIVSTNLAGPLLGQLIALGIAVGVSFVALNFWAFHDRGGSLRQAAKSIRVSAFKFD